MKRTPTLYAWWIVGGAHAVYQRIIGPRMARVAKTLAASYRSGRKVQLRHWSRIHRAALMSYGWDCYARRVVNRWQLCYAPATPDAWSQPSTDCIISADGRIL